MDYSVDTAIIGAGPAGIACAITLEKAHISNCVIDRKVFPRSKTCGGLITEKTMRVILSLLNVSSIEEIKDAFCDTCNMVSLYYQTKMLSSAETEKSFFFVDRTVFDNYLVTHYKKMGGVMFEGVPSYTIDYKNNTIIFKNGDRVIYRILIAADGATSSTRNSLGLKLNRKAFCVETHVPKSECAYKNSIGVYFGVIPNGYAWVFPSGDTMCIGLGGLFSKQINYADILSNFLKSLGVIAQHKFKGAFLPYGEIVDNKILDENIALIGDAGGFVDPIYGEGLFFALSSGIEAAKAQILVDQSFRSTFNHRMKPYAKIIKQGAHLQKFFFLPVVQRFFFKLITNRSNFLKFYCDNQISEYAYSYANLIKLAVDYKKRKRCRHVDS